MEQSANTSMYKRLRWEDPIHGTTSRSGCEFQPTIR